MNSALLDSCETKPVAAPPWAKLYAGLSVYMSGDGPKPIKPEPLRAAKSADLTTVKNVSCGTQWD